jgi:hypothetical protein
MNTSGKMALVAALILGSTSMSLAQERTHTRHHAMAHRSFQSREVALPQTTVSPAEEAWMDRASDGYGVGDD